MFWRLIASIARVWVFPFAPFWELASADLISVAAELRERTGFGNLAAFLVRMGVDVLQKA